MYFHRVQAVFAMTAADAAAKPKTEKELAKEAAKAAKLAKLEAKQKKQAEEKEKNKNKEPKKDLKKKDIVEYTIETEVGAKKSEFSSFFHIFLCLDVTSEFPNAYSPKYVEAAWYEWWEKEGFFRPEYGRDLKYVYYNKKFSYKKLSCIWQLNFMIYNI